MCKHTDFKYKYANFLHLNFACVKISLHFTSAKVTNKNLNLALKCEYSAYTPLYNSLISKHFHPPSKSKSRCF